MWIYLAHLGILIPWGLQPTAPCPPPLLGQRAVIVILRSRPQGPSCRSFCFSHAPILTIGNTLELLVSYSGGQFSRHWSSS